MPVNIMTSTEIIASRPDLRKVLTGTLACLVATLIYFATVSPDLLERFVLATFAAAIAIEYVMQFRRERSVLLKPGEADATVLERSRLGWRRGIRIRYVFMAADGKRNPGTIIGSVFLPQPGQQINVLYRSEDPTQNLPRCRFWVHELPGTSSMK